MSSKDSVACQLADERKLRVLTVFQNKPFGMIMVKVFPKSGNQSNEMALTICNCFRQMRDWKVENLANVKELYTVPIATEKEVV